MQCGTSYPNNEGCHQRKISVINDTSTTATTTIGRAEGFFAYSPSEETRGFEIGSSAALASPLPPSEDTLLGCGAIAQLNSRGSNTDTNRSCTSGDGNSRRSLHKANPSKNRDGAPVSVVALDMKYIKVCILVQGVARMF